MEKNNQELSYNEAFDQNYSMMVKRCKRKIGPNDAEDIVIDSFTLLFEKWDSFDNHKEKVLTVWLYKTLDNKCNDYIRKKYKEEKVIEYLGEFEEEDIDTSAEYTEYCNYIDEILLRLTPAEKEVFECLICKGMSSKEAEEYIGISGVTLRVRWLRTKKHISSFLTEILQR